jgi:hypothetical protein
MVNIFAVAVLQSTPEDGHINTTVMHLVIPTRQAGLFPLRLGARVKFLKMN